jgi:hypothetical protein
MNKEDLLKFDGEPLFPERIAYIANYCLSSAEAYLCSRVADYVIEKFNRPMPWRMVVKEQWVLPLHLILPVYSETLPKIMSRLVVVTE